MENPYLTLEQAHEIIGDDPIKLSPRQILFSYFRMNDPSGLAVNACKNALEKYKKENRIFGGIHDKDLLPVLEFILCKENGIIPDDIRSKGREELAYIVAIRDNERKQGNKQILAQDNLTKFGNRYAPQVA